MKLSKFRTSSLVRWRLVAGGGTGQRGATLVEQALILPILVALFFGIVDMGRALYSYTYVSYIARDAARWASARGTTLNNTRTRVSQTDVINYVKNVSGQGLDASQLTANAAWIAPPNGSPLCTGGTGPVNEKPGCIVQVTVTYNFQFFFRFIPVGTLPMSSESQMIITQ
jgi:Flp pilus assembly protein TadG